MGSAGTTNENTTNQKETVEDKIKRCKMHPQPGYLGKAVLEFNFMGMGINELVEKPTEAKYFRLEGGIVRFYHEKPEGLKNGYKIMPGLAQFVSFPEIRQRKNHIVYGEPVFYDSSKKRVLAT